MTASHSEAGFSLVETLVALAIIAGMSALLFESVSANAHFAQTVAKRRDAVLLAQSLLAAVEAPSDSASAADTGSVRGLTWRITRISRSGGARDSGVPLQEVWIVISDRATGRGLTDVRTLRLSR
ncbi:type II secretion system protein [Sphingomonas sp. dw_22]|uniref:type II secretion system protein n=1 Tax=Sphingomonas sp. dw_22 TaxID=2721175 RepID=UPI001BD593F6|nr:type II secretion system protein [Sphingomonas sp. dw_22]